MDGMCRYINMRKNKKLAKGVNQVMTLSQSIFSRGVQEGVEKGPRKKAKLKALPKEKPRHNRGRSQKLHFQRKDLNEEHEEVEGRGSCHAG